MKIFLAGATGVIGRRLVPMLVDRGHDVVGTTRSARKAETLRDTGADAVVWEGRDLQALEAAVVQAEPEVVIHQLTALTGTVNMRDVDRFFATTNALRTTGTDHLLAAALKVGARRFVAQSFTGWTNPRSGGPVKTEDDPLDPTPERRTRRTIEAIAHLERTVTGAQGIAGLALRYGLLYGPGTALAPGGQLYEMVERRRLPLVGGGTGVWSWIHVDDAAAATLAAVERGQPGTYNVVDDEPAPVSEWLPYLAAAIGAQPPRRVPALLVRPLLGRPGISAMTRIRGSSNARAKRDLGFELRYPTWREGFRTGL